MPMVEDPAAFLSVAEHGTEAFYDGSATAIVVLFDAEYIPPLQDGSGFGGVGIGSTQPMLYCFESDVPGIAGGKAFVINGTNYTSVGPPEPDGTGWVQVMLQEA